LPQVNGKRACYDGFDTAHDCDCCNSRLTENSSGQKFDGEILIKIREGARLPNSVELLELLRKSSASSHMRANQAIKLVVVQEVLRRLTSEEESGATGVGGHGSLQRKSTTDEFATLTSGSLGFDLGERANRRRYAAVHAYYSVVQYCRYRYLSKSLTD
jgi:hypothetical protein